MKKRVRLVAVLLLFSLLLTSTTTIIAGEYSIVDPYDYPIVPCTNEWRELESLQEMIEVSQVPEELVDNMFTSALLWTVLDYPLLVNMFVYDTTTIGINEVKGYFYGLQQFLIREDALSEISAIVNSNQYEALNMMQQKTLMALYKYIAGTMGMQSASLGGGSALPQYTTVYITTPADTLVQLRYNCTWGDHGMTASEGAEWQQHLVNTYPNATVVRSENPKYNCHSYTFVSTSSTNKYWLQPNQAYFFVSDGSYTSVTPAQVGDKVWYGLYHSGIVYSKSNGVVTLTSKWGYAGLFRHTVTYCPYNSNNGVYYYR